VFTTARFQALLFSLVRSSKVSTLSNASATVCLPAHLLISQKPPRACRLSPAGRRWTLGKSHLTLCRYPYAKRESAESVTLAVKHQTLTDTRQGIMRTLKHRLDKLKWSLTLPTTANHCQSLPITANHCQSLPITANHCQSLPITANHCQSLPSTANRYHLLLESYYVSRIGFSTQLDQG
jgi:hypothetical protein